VPRRFDTSRATPISESAQAGSSPHAPISLQAVDDISSLDVPSTSQPTAHLHGRSRIGFGILALLLSIATCLAPTAADAIELRADEVRLELTGDGWRRAGAEAVAGHRRREGFADAALFQADDGPRLSVVVLQATPDTSVGPAAPAGSDADALSDWVEASVAALVDQPFVRDVQGDVVSLEGGQRVARLELVRNGPALREELDLGTDTAIHQTIFALPTRDGLVQVFAYTPVEAETLADDIEGDVLETLSAPSPVSTEAPATRSDRSLYWIAIGVLAALLLIVTGLRVYNAVKRRQARAAARAGGGTGPDVETTRRETPKAAFEDALAEELDGPPRDDLDGQTHGEA